MSADPPGAGLKFRHIFVIRLINALTMATFFQPDEYFQSLEPAWTIAFGSESGAWKTWEWQHQLRSSLHPLLFSIPYTIANATFNTIQSGGFSPSVRSTMLMAAPAILQAYIAALGDWYSWKLAQQIYGSDSAPSTFTILLQLFSPWQWYCSSRTFSNSLETTLCVAALAHWPWQLVGTTPTKENSKVLHTTAITHLRVSLCLAALAIVLRPTNILIWLTIAVFTLTHLTLRGSSPITLSTVTILAREAILCGSLVVGASILADRAFFGFWTFPPYNWLNFNISKSLAVFYGRNPWHYYLFQGIPLLCTTSLPFVLQALYRPKATTDHQANTLRILSATVFVTCVTLSLISHKEVRFIYPLLPILNVVASPYAASFFTTAPAGPEGRRMPRHTNYLLGGILVNILLAGYLSYAHQRGPLTVLSYLRSQFEHIHKPTLLHPVPTAPDSELFALFLMPCHSTPWRSHLIYPSLNAYALSCDPPLHTEPNTPERDDYRDEADRFYDNPVPFLSGELFQTTLASSPRYVVGFEGVEPWLKDFVKTEKGESLQWDLKPVWSGFNGLFHEDWRRAGNIVVWDTGVYKSDRS